nr:MAG TPA: hypothetical protein [Caudoviricetes sp.]
MTPPSFGHLLWERRHMTSSMRKDDAGCTRSKEVMPWTARC